MIKKLPEFDQLTEYVVQGKDGLEVKKCEAKAEKESERIAFLAEKAGFVK